MSSRKVLDISTENFNYLNDPFPNFRQPTIIGHFSMNGNRDFMKDLSGLQYLVQRETRVNLDLDQNINGVIKPLPIKDDERITNLLKGVLAYKNRFAVDGELKSLQTDFVCFRGLLTVLLCTPYERQDDWCIEAVKWKGTIYLLAIPTSRRLASKDRETERQRQMSSWGYKFEQYMTSSTPSGVSDTQSPVNENEEFCCLFRTRINGISLVYGAEMDAYQSQSNVKENEQLDPGKFMELKTSRVIEHERQDRNFRKFKLLKWWGQSFLVGTKQIICGWRDDRGIVSELETIQVKNIPKMAVDWKPNVCASFLAQFLSKIKTVITEDNLDIVYSIYLDPKVGDVQVTKRHSSSEHILPKWYINCLFML